MEENLKQLPSDIIRIALFGPESTGKTTLAKQLAEHFQTTWVPEFARDYLEEKLEKTGEACDLDDMMPIAAGQIRLENEALPNANKYLFCDTCLLVTKVYSETYYDYCEPALSKAAKKHQYDLFFLTNIDMPWEKDKLRDSPEYREEAFRIFRQSLIDLNKPYITLSGDVETRLKKAIRIVEDYTKAKELGFSAHDFVTMHKKGIQLDNIIEHLQVFSKGIAKTNLLRPATVGDGIIRFSEQEFQQLVDFFDSRKAGLKLMKFVPASGAASRMFKFLNEFLHDFDPENDTINSYINKRDNANLRIFLAGLDKFPFFETIKTILQELHEDYASWDSDKKHYHFIKLLLDPEYFNFSNKPKAILPFHKYATHTATPIEEHLREAALYASSDDMAHLHFTISEIHRSQIEKIIEREINKVENQFNTKINIEFSFQNAATDTIAVAPDNTPFRNDLGELVFRPAGHGALVNNLNHIDADLIFMKNIDNVTQNHVSIISFYKKALAGCLLQVKNRIFTFLDRIDNDQFSEDDLADVLHFLGQELNIILKEDFHKYTFENKIQYISILLNRPIRVCGMVKNEGEPGGGPFWTLSKNGDTSLQIVESAQIDLQNPSQAAILAQATHFNPVDIVCCIKDFRGNKFDLTQFVDPESGFIVAKNKGGRDLKAYELPGLWNGAMANWISIFVEVPLITFNPVKTVNDLLKPLHQPQ